ncbi:hypothetical protein EQV77_08410 [Halobacillus fulvus]|nr:hypothetical protein EQV77_08410 [Halobacillus fulvus]
MYRVLVLMMVLVMLSACGLQVEKYQGQTSRDDVENMGANNKVTSETEHPRMVQNVGDTWGKKQDREQIRTAVELMPEVSVKRIILEAGRAWVTVDVEGEDELSESEKKDWQEEIEQAIYKAAPRYDVQVKVK